MTQRASNEDKYIDFIMKIAEDGGIRIYLWQKMILQKLIKGVK